MQRKHLGNMMRYLVVVLALCSSLALFACSSDDDDNVVRDVNRTVDVRNANTIASIVGQDFSVPGAAFGLPNANVTLRFTSTTAFTLTAGNSTASGTVAFGSATFTFTVTGGIPGLVGGSFPTFRTFEIVIIATGVEVGGGSVQGQVTIVLTNAAGTRFPSAPITLSIAIDANGFLVINGVTTTIPIDPPPPTGATGTGGQ